MVVPIYFMTGSQNETDQSAIYVTGGGALSERVALLFDDTAGGSAQTHRRSESCSSSRCSPEREAKINVPISDTMSGSAGIHRVIVSSVSSGQ